MPKVSIAELEELLEEEKAVVDPGIAKDIQHPHYFPRRYERKDFTLLFPKKPADESAIKKIAGMLQMDCNALLESLRYLEEPIHSKQAFKMMFGDFKRSYMILWTVVRDSGETYGITLRDYGIFKKKMSVAKAHQKV